MEFVHYSYGYIFKKNKNKKKKHKNHISAITAPMLKTVYVENSEQLLWENSKQFYLMQKTDFMNAVSTFEYTINMMGRVQILLMYKQILSMKKNRFDYCKIQT